MENLTNWLKTRCRRQCASSGVRFLLEALALFEGLLLALWGLEALARPLAESTATALLLMVCTALLAATAFRLWRLLRNASPLAKAREFGREHPEEHDALEAAVELEMRSAHGQLRPFEERFLADRQKYFADDDYRRLRSSKAFEAPPWRRIALAAALLGAWCLLVRPPILLRAWNGVTCRTPGLLFLPFPTELPRHRDLEVVVQVNRYGGIPTLELREPNHVSTTPMQPLGDNRYRLMLYDVTEPITLRAYTNFLSSKRLNVSVFEPPSPERIAMDTKAPAYSGRMPQHRDDFADLELLVGESLTVTCEMPAGQSWSLRNLSQPEAPPLQGRVSATLGTTIEARQNAVTLPQELLAKPGTLHFQAEYHDSDGHIANGPAFALTLRPDSPPAIELIEPEKDATCTPDEKPRLHAIVADDFGVTRVEVHFFLDTQPETTQLLWQPTATPPRQAEVVSPLSFGETQPSPGQVITGWLEAADNHPPEAQRVRSELFFITITPDSNAFEGNMEGMEGAASREVDINDLLLESKRLLRNTFDLLSGGFEPPFAERLATELERDLRAFELAIRTRSIDLAQQFGMTQLPPQLQDFFNDSAMQIVQAATDVSAGAIADSRTPQQSALTTLTQLQILLMENRMKMSGGDGAETVPQPGGEPDEEGDEPSAAQPQSAPADRQQQLAQLQDAQAELRKILQEQRSLLDEVRRANRIAASFADPERLLSARTQGVAAKIAGVAEAQEIQPILRNAMTDLDSAGQDFATSGQQERAAIHARRAEKNLQDALTALEALLIQLAAQQVDKLSEDAQRLAERQRALADDSRAFSAAPPDDAARQRARDAQEQLAQETEELRQRMEQASRAMERDNPQAAKQLRSAMSNEEKAALQRAQSRARNALTYRRYENAAQEQEAAANNLQALSQRLAEFSAQTGLSSEEVQQALEEMQRLADEAAASQGLEELGKLAREASQMASQTAQRLGSDALQMIGQELTEAVEHGETPELLRTEILQQLAQARAVLRAELARLEEDTKKRFMPPATAPPRQYRHEVEEYFRRLGE